MRRELISSDRARVKHPVDRVNSYLSWLVSEGDSSNPPHATLRTRANSAAGSVCAGPRFRHVRFISARGAGVHVRPLKQRRRAIVRRRYRRRHLVQSKTGANPGRGQQRGKSRQALAASAAACWRFVALCPGGCDSAVADTAPSPGGAVTARSAVAVSASACGPARVLCSFAWASAPVPCARVRVVIARACPRPWLLTGDRSPPHQLEETGNLVRAIRTCSRHKALDYLHALSLMQSRKHHDVLDTVREGTGIWPPGGGGAVSLGQPGMPQRESLGAYIQN